ncbi:MAG TPA: MqnA/MqnD/SBP family protein [Bacteroidota bacterium]|nr:MqnA/MqnD/SBP family protein [Bacteroidota bacterium]
MARRLGILRDRFVRPLFSGLVQRTSRAASAAPQFELVSDSPAQLVLKLREAQLDGAFLSPLDYARGESTARIIPRIAAVSKGESGTVRLLVSEKVRLIKSVAVNIESSGSDIVLANIILREKFEVAPVIVPFMPPADPFSLHADAVLFTGDQEFPAEAGYFPLDLVDEWYDLTVLPYVHGFWVVPEDKLSLEEVETILKATQTGLQQLNILGDDSAAVRPGEFGYSLNDEALSAVAEFFRLAFYHGILKDIPDLRFVK